MSYKKPHKLLTLSILFLNVGDSGYGQSTWLMTPLRHPRGHAELEYNKAHRKTRNLIERTIALLKMRFLCLARPGGELLYAPEKVAKIILACCVLHNICKGYHVQLEEEADIEPEVHHRSAPAEHSTESGRLARASLIARFFQV